MKLIDLTGMRFGQLTVKARGPSNKHNNSRWFCDCDCGISNKLMHVYPSRTKSCGCSHTKHGFAKTKLYNTWARMLDRCTNKNNVQYEYYGARGITVCTEWAKNFTEFKAWALSNGFSSNLSIERINNDAGYSPTNCKWATVTEQNRNRRTVCLDEETVQLAKTLYLYGTSPKEIALILQANKATIFAAITNRSWKDVGGLPV